MLLVVALGAFASACAPRLAAMGLQNEAPHIESGADGERYVTRDGLRLGLSHWDAIAPKAVIVALHGMSDYSHAFALPAPWFAEQGITTYAYDQRGFGRSPNRGLWAGENVMCQDLSDFVDLVRMRHPGLPVFVLGESMGGAVAMTAFASDTPPHADGVILVAPAVWGRDTMPFSYRATLWITAHLFPYWELSGSGLHIWPSDNLPVLREIGRDPLFIKVSRTDAIYGLVQLMDHAYASAAALGSYRVMLCFGDKDQIIPRAPTRDVQRLLGRGVAVREYPNGYHMLLRDIQGPKVWADIAAWVESVSLQRTSVTDAMKPDARG